LNKVPSGEIHRQIVYLMWMLPPSHEGVGARSAPLRPGMSVNDL
jgi:hypothetical protein